MFAKAVAFATLFAVYAQKMLQLIKTLPARVKCQIVIFIQKDYPVSLKKPCYNKLNWAVV
jgi:hypothetical protein